MFGQIKRIVAVRHGRRQDGHDAGSTRHRNACRPRWPQLRPSRPCAATPPGAVMTATAGCSPAASAGPATDRRTHAAHLVDERAGGVDAFLEALFGRASNVDTRIAAGEGEARAARLPVPAPPAGVAARPARPLAHHPAVVRTHHPGPHPAVTGDAALPARLAVPLAVTRPLVRTGVRRRIHLRAGRRGVTGWRFGRLRQQGRRADDGRHRCRQDE